MYVVDIEVIKEDKEEDSNNPGIVSVHTSKRRYSFESPAST